jgi:hypothetical protein
LPTPDACVDISTFSCGHAPQLGERPCSTHLIGASGGFRQSAQSSVRRRPPPCRGPQDAPASDFRPPLKAIRSIGRGSRSTRFSARVNPTDCESMAVTNHGERPA